MTDVLAPSGGRLQDAELEAAIATVPAPASPHAVTADDDEATAWLRPRRLRSGRWVVASIIGAQAIASLRLRNSVFQDEALYIWAGHQITAHVQHGTPLYGNFSTYFSGSPGLYPVIASLVDSVWGVAGARALSLVWMVVATLCVHRITKRLFGVHAAAPAAAAFALSAPVLFIGHLATMDAMCVGLLALATYASVRAAEAPSVRWAGAVGALAVLAVLTKYAAALYVPTILVVLVVESRRHRDSWAAMRKLAAALAASSAVVGLVVAVFGTAILDGLRSTTVNRTVEVPATAWYLVSRALSLGGCFAAVALAGCFAVPRRQRALGALLFGTVFLAPAYHLYKGEPVSLAKHVGFGLFFAAPLVGLALVRLAGRAARLSGRRFAAAVAVGLVLVGTGLSQSVRLEREWPNSDRLVATLKSLVRPVSGRVLAEEDEVPRYRLRHLLQPWQWTDLHWFEYTTRGGAHLSGLDAYRAAIDDGYFDVIELRYGADAATAVAIRDDIAQAGGYQLVATLPFQTSYGSGAYSLWRRSTGSASVGRAGDAP